MWPAIPALVALVEVADLAQLRQALGPDLRRAQALLVRVPLGCVGRPGRGDRTGNSGVVEDGIARRGGAEVVAGHVEREFRARQRLANVKKRWVVQRARRGWARGGIN